MRSFIFLAGLLLAGSASAQPAADAWSLLMAGEYHHGEAPEKPGRGWLALVAQGGVWRLEPAIVRATRIHDAVLDAEGQKTGIRISANYSEAIALLRFPGLRAGKVDTPNWRFKDNPRLISRHDTPVTLSFKGEVYRIEAGQSAIHLGLGTQKTVLADLAPGGEDSEDTASLLWAGDLDGDGKLDLLFAYTGYNRGGACLYLSSGAGEGALVRQLACHGGVGC